MKITILFPTATYYSGSKASHRGVKRRFLLNLILCALTVLISVNAFSQNNPNKTEFQHNGMSGDWVADLQIDAADKLEITLVKRPAAAPNAIGVWFSRGELKGLALVKADSEKTKVDFTAERDAGTFTFEGNFERGRGTGSWSFAPSKNFVSVLSSRGYTDLSETELLQAAMHDLTVQFIEDLQALGSNRFEFRQLLRAKANKVDSRYIEEVKEMGLGRQPLDTLIWMRNHGINRALSDKLKSQGYTNLTLEKLIELRAQGR